MNTAAAQAPPACGSTYLQQRNAPQWDGKPTRTNLRKNPKTLHPTPPTPVTDLTSLHCRCSSVRHHKEPAGPAELSSSELLQQQDLDLLTGPASKKLGCCLKYKQRQTEMVFKSLKPIFYNGKHNKKEKICMWNIKTEKRSHINKNMLSLVAGTNTFPKKLDPPCHIPLSFTSADIKFWLLESPESSLLCFFVSWCIKCFRPVKVQASSAAELLQLSNFHYKVSLL